VQAPKKGGKLRRKGETQAKSMQPYEPNPMPPLDLCNLHGHTTNNFPTLPWLKILISLDEIQPYPKFPMVQIPLHESSKKNTISLCENHPCSLC